jgi:predicted dienelactone hydrolase
MSEGRPKPLAIISHGYGGHNGDYSFIADSLAAQGYLVASIEHTERPGDPPMINTGDLGKR